MRTARSSSHHGTPRADTPTPGPDPPSTSPLGVGLDQIPLNFPLACWPGDPPPRPDPSKPPPLALGLETCKACWDTTLPWRPAAMHAGIAPPPVDRHTPVNILPLPQTSFAGGKYAKLCTRHFVRNNFYQWNSRDLSFFHSHFYGHNLFLD